ncbi:DEAD/DEAH box helicase [Variovorax robiniae]|uniref:DEAD/DEAH box helicase n=1 Tax=Variovorax robiniae TaxID=1836199 RepID=A0ABU8XFN8_9BURK
MGHEFAAKRYALGEDQRNQHKNGSADKSGSGTRRRRPTPDTLTRALSLEPASTQSPLTVYVRTSLDLSIHALQFRRALRHAARRACTQRPQPPSKVPLVTRAVLYALWLPQSGIRSAPLALERSRQASIRGSLQPFLCELRDARCTTNASLLRRNARLERIAAIAGVDEDDLVAGIQAFMAVLQPLRHEAPDRASLEGRRMIQVPQPFRSTDPPLQLARAGSRAFFGLPDALHPTQLANVLAIGGTGAGKTASALVPVLDALLRYRLHNGKAASLLVVDPKNELSARVHATLQELGELDRLVVIDGSTPPIEFFPANSPLTPSERLAKLEVFLPARNDAGDNAYWRGLGMAFLRDLVQLDDAFAHASARQGLQMRIFHEIALELGCASGPASFWSDVRNVMACARLSGRHLVKVSRLIGKHCKSVDLDLGAIARTLEAYTADRDLIEQFNYVLMSACDTLGALMADPETKSLVDFDVRPIGEQPRTNVLELVQEGKVILFSPEMRAGHRLAAQALKTKFFEAVFARTDQERPIGIVVDEAQRFVTSDPESGEQSFLDRCRAFRCITLLATQSLASLRYELGSLSSGQAALEIMGSNLPSKFFFRSTDDQTVNWLRNQLPHPGNGGAHIVDVRRPAQLRPGEAYYLLADGQWGRGQADLQGLACVEPTTENRHPA